MIIPVIRVSTPIGNIYSDEAYRYLKNENFEKLKLSRANMQKRALKAIGDMGTEIEINLIPGIDLAHGDVIDNHGTKIVVLQIPEKVIAVYPKVNSTGNMIMVLLGHIIGTHHRPISMSTLKIMFPIVSDSELAVFTKYFHSIIDFIDLRIEEQVFKPHSAVLI